MTIPEWNLILNATILVLMAGYAFWLNHITKQQDKLKTNTVEALNAGIASKDAEIARLKGEAAPELARSYKAMKDYAEEMTKRTNSLEQDLEKLRRDIGEREGLLSVNYLSGEAEGYMRAAAMVIATEQVVAKEMERAGSVDLFRIFHKVGGDIVALAQKKNDAARAQLRPKA